MKGPAAALLRSAAPAARLQHMQAMAAAAAAAASTLAAAAAAAARPFVVELERRGHDVPGRQARATVRRLQFAYRLTPGRRRPEKVAARRRPGGGRGPVACSDGSDSQGPGPDFGRGKADRSADHGPAAGTSESPDPSPRLAGCGMVRSREPRSGGAARCSTIRPARQPASHRRQRSKACQSVALSAA